ncbi:MAG TPA: phosphoenolpyruvate--protein phosphotransferase [Ktedonobacteraceae bacterium]|nr:phosphoenolpyruvate--protein phosphotransferase [Ktedonobacteraceae bacterium]
MSSSLLPAHPTRVVPISPGIAIGPARIYRAANLAMGETKIHPQQVEAEQQRLQAAITVALQELQAVQTHVARTVGSNEAAIFEAQQLMLQDPDLVEETNAVIATQLFSAGAALRQVAERLVGELEALANETLAARAADVRDVTARVLRHLHTEGQSLATGKDEDTPVLIVAYDLTPSDTATFDPGKILGICTVVGGPTTHAAIIARALEIPAVCGIDAHVLESLQDGRQLAIDGAQGLLYTQFDTLEAQALRAAMEQQREERARRRSQHETLWRTQPGATADGVRVQVFANVGDVESARSAAELGGEGIGLLRTEFLFGGREIFPDEQEQYESYLALFRAFGERAILGKTIIARTLDAGADKPFPALEPLIGSMQEANPALGLRGARIHLVHEALLRQQLRALLRAGVAANIELAIMFPMIATVEEVRRLCAVYDEVFHELEREGLAVSVQTRVGIMVETPAAALMADVLARYVDFFSIGANDLFQYTMAVDRTNSRVTSMFGMLEPAVWRSIDRTVQAGAAHGKLVAVCGELAADPRIGPLLAGLGVKELSMSPPAMLKVKAALHAHPLDYWQQRARELLKAETAADVQAVLQSIE